jgi:hypothetical protein
MRGCEVGPGALDGNLCRYEARAAGATGVLARAMLTATADTAIERTSVITAMSSASPTAPRRPRRWRGSVNPTSFNPAEDMAPSCSESVCNGAKIGPKSIFDSS